MTRTDVGRVVHHAERNVAWHWDTTLKQWVEYPFGLTETEQDRIEGAVAAVDRDRLGLSQAVRHARARGFTWAKISTILGLNQDDVRQRFEQVDAELRKEGIQLPNDEVTPATKQPDTVTLVPKQPEPVAYDFSGLRSLPEQELIDLAKKLPTTGNLMDPYLRAQREAIVVELYRRNWSQTKIAALINKSSQRVSQIVGQYHNRLAQEWKRQRAQWDQEG